MTEGTERGGKKGGGETAGKSRETSGGMRPDSHDQRQPVRRRLHNQAEARRTRTKKPNTNDRHRNSINSPSSMSLRG
jgi:hypothetical protein